LDALPFKPQDDDSSANHGDAQPLSRYWPFVKENDREDGDQNQA
jgi:hypothetical protein